MWCEEYLKTLLGIFPKEWGTQCPVKNVFFKERGSFFKEPVLAGTPAQSSAIVPA